MATQRNKQSASTTRRRNGASEGTGATTMMRADHRSAEKLFRQFEAEESAERKAELARRACNELVVHAMLEEEIFYPACREIDGLGDALDEAQVEHDTVKLLIRDVLGRSPGDPYYDARVKVLSEYVKHHVAEEEKPDGGMFAQARTGRLPPPVPRSLASSETTDQGNQEIPTMQRERERDRNGGRGPSEGRGWHGDPEGYAEAARRRWEDQGGSRSWRGRDDDDRRGSRSGR